MTRLKEVFYTGDFDDLERLDSKVVHNALSKYVDMLKGSEALEAEMKMIGMEPAAIKLVLGKADMKKDTPYVTAWNLLVTLPNFRASQTIAGEMYQDENCLKLWVAHMLGVCQFDPDIRVDPEE